MNGKYHGMGFLKSQSRIKGWYKRFRLKKHDDYPFEPVPCLDNGGKESNINVLRNNILMALSANDDNLGSFSDGEDRPSKKSKSRRGLSRAVKAILFPIAARKNRSRKSDQEKSFRSNSSLSSKLDKKLVSFRGEKSSYPSTTSMHKDSSDGSLGTDSSGSSLLSSASITPASSSLASSRSSSIASNSRSPSERKRSFVLDLKQLEKKPPTMMICSRTSRKRNGFCNPMLGLYFLLICLLVLVLCGKAVAIFCTSTCLFLIPCWFRVADDQSSCEDDDDDDVDCIDFDSDEYKKKIVLEGLLERRRTTRVL